MRKESFGVRSEARLAAAVASAYRYLAQNRVTRTPWAVIQTFSKAEGALLFALSLGTVLLASVGLTIWVAYLAPVALGNDSIPVATWIEPVVSPVALLLVLVLLYRVLPARALSW
jgi:hypothetical protein